MHRLFIASAAALIAGAACAQETDSARGNLIDRDGRAIGQVFFDQGPGELLITIDARDVAETHRDSWHGAHLHAIGSCASADFTSSGGHINPSGRPHGLLNPEGPDNADLPNIWVHSDGTIIVELTTSRVRLIGDGETPGLLDEDGSALVIHAGRDDHSSQPIGGAGARILCAEIYAN